VRVFHARTAKSTSWVMEWFLCAGIIYILSGVINQVQERVEEMAILDGIVRGMGLVHKVRFNV
jgi:hypothetical protein